jgi:hypothetical protein
LVPCTKRQTLLQRASHRTTTEGGPGPGGRVLCPEQPQIEDVRVRGGVRGGGGGGGVGMVLAWFWHGVDIVVERFGVDLV